MRVVTASVLLLLSLATAEVAQADFVVDYSGTNAYGIRNLDMGGQLYDVEFLFDFGADIFTFPLTFPTWPQAVLAASEVSQALNSVAEVVTVGEDGGVNSDFFNIPFELEADVGWGVRSAEYSPLAGSWHPLVSSDLVPELTPSSFAIFTLAAYLEADFNTDGYVDGNDFLAWQSGFGIQTEAQKSDGDYDNDGDVDGNDFLGWQAEFDPSDGSSSSAVPEPASMALLLFTFAIGMLRRRPIDRRSR